MLSFIFGFGLARPIFLAAVIAVIPILIWQWRSLTHFPAYMQTLLLLLRIGVVLVIVSALAGPVRVEQNFRKFILFAIDQSGSIPEHGFSEHKSFIDKAIESKGDNDYAILPFAGKPGVVASAPIKPASELLTPIVPSQTDYAKASVLAEAIVPEDSVGEVVLMSDFQIAKSAPEQQGKINQFGIDVYSVDIASKIERPEILIDSIIVPQTVRVGQPFQVEVRVKSNTAQKAEIALSLADTPRSATAATEGATEAKATTAELAKTAESTDKKGGSDTSDNSNKSVFPAQQIEFAQPGIQTVRFDFTPAQTQAYSFQAIIANPDSSLKDTLSENNVFNASVVALPQGKVLLVENKPNLAAPLSKALAAEFLTITACTTESFPDDLDEFEAIILSNTPSTALNEFELFRLEEYITSGGGVIALGGDQSFTAGGWHGTKLEELMPVECVEQGKQPRPSLAMVLVLDRSASMKPDGSPDGQPGTAIELAKEAARRAVGVLSPTDQLGILTYEDNYNWNVELAPVLDSDAIIKKIDSIKAEGRTNLYPALCRAKQALEESFADLKHIIVLTDGVSQPGDFNQLAQQIAASGITMSSVAVGEEADPQILADLARFGKGTMYACKDPAELPSIFALETASAAKIGIIERTTKLQSAGTLSSLGKFDASKSPSLLGYVQTKPKSGAFVVYAAPAIEGISDPILAWHRYKGNAGIVAAFTSDVESRWSRAWLRWDGFGPFWSRLVNHVRRPDPATQYKIVDNGTQMKITGPIVESNNLSCNITDKSGKIIAEVPLICPGVFAINSPSEKGELQVNVLDNNQTIWQGKIGIVQNYTDEYRLDKSISVADSNQSIPPAIEAGKVFVKSDKSVSKTYRYWQYLLWLGVCMTAAEVFFRRTGIA